MSKLHTHNQEWVLPVTEILRFCTQDGPGIRTTVFVKGCTLRCFWCHNPETQSAKQQVFFTSHRCFQCQTCINVCPTHAHFLDSNGIHAMDGTLCIGCLLCVEACPYRALEAVARFMPVGDILEEVMRDRVFYGDLGGITISGGEPGLFPEEVLALLKLSKEHGISTVLETSGYFDERYLPDLVRYTDLFLWDFKDGDDKRHIHNTQVSHQKILQNLYRADALGAVTILRSPLIRGVNMDDTHFRKFAQVASSLKNCVGCELLPYHPYGTSKKVQLGFLEDARKEMIPSEADVLLAKKKLLDYLSVYYNGGESQ